MAASVAFSFGLACVMPFAALCAVGACTLPRRDAFAVAGMAWLANQVVGFGFLHYPVDGVLPGRGVPCSACRHSSARWWLAG